ncbi:acyltransferase [Mucilaginibacter psychrotolerans]|uniref:N-acetyltransferase n=1 Tax=Mucilaginibacter psychrotolerans TaxID=1524096 RepID=A0A4Y8SAF3_9SPHI|nr:acyltransferase [Mucilaginibacter psychrotolerans]TFF35527.1 N-acetyltransferase [Mucilaginibacter psychrotolerans]
MDYRIHPLADVQSSSIGEGTTIWQFCVVFKQAIIGKNCNICANCIIENRVSIGDNVTVKSGVQVWDGITVDDNVFIGPNVTFTNDTYPRSKKHLDEYGKIHVKKGATIGANSTILPNVIIGEYSLIGAGTVVTKDIPPFSVWYGNPAVHKGYITKEAVVLTLELTDKVTGDKYCLTDNDIKKV